jgi:hypothetical protein
MPVLVQALLEYAPTQIIGLALHYERLARRLRELGGLEGARGFNGIVHI